MLLFVGFGNPKKFIHAMQSQKKAVRTDVHSFNFNERLSTHTTQLKFYQLAFLRVRKKFKETK